MAKVAARAGKVAGNIAAGARGVASEVGPRGQLTGPRSGKLTGSVRRHLSVKGRSLLTPPSRLGGDPESRSRTLAVGPLRCLATMISAVPFSGESAL
jgi:hypothetical protein